eukprot:5967405-Prymnesium_polylepis.1
MHGSQTHLGGYLDTKGQFVVALLAHQIAIAGLPAGWRDNAVLTLALNSKLQPQPSGVQLSDMDVRVYNETPATEWRERFALFPEAD